MKPEEIVSAMVNAMQKGEFESARTFLTEDFQFKDEGDSLGADDWMKMSADMLSAFPDLQYHFKFEGVEGNVVMFSADMSGTHKGALDLSMMGLGVIQPTGKSFHTPRQNGRATLRGDKVSGFDLEPQAGAGWADILQALGVEMPKM